jgi:hypothetical protein
MSVQALSRTRRSEPPGPPREPRGRSGTTPPPNPPLLHRLLGIGLVLVALAFLGLTYLGIAPLRPVDTVTPLIVYASSGFVVGLTAVVVVVFKPRVPRRGSGQSIEEYWSLPEVGAAVSVVWFLLEGAGIIATVGYGLSGEPVSAITMGLAIATYWLCGPSQFAKA